MSSKNMWWLLGIAAALYVIHNATNQYPYTAGYVAQPAFNPALFVQGIEQL